MTKTGGPIYKKYLGRVINNYQRNNFCSGTVGYGRLGACRQFGMAIGTPAQCFNIKRNFFINS